MGGWGVLSGIRRARRDNSIYHQGVYKRQRCLDLSLSLSDFGNETFTFRITEHMEIRRVIAELDLGQFGWERVGLALAHQ